MSIFNDFDENDRDMFHSRIIDDFSMITLDSTTADNHESTLGTGTNDLGNDTWDHKNQVKGAFELFGNSINTGNITANISGSNCDHKSCVEDELLSYCDMQESVDDEATSYCDTKEKVDDETNSNCDTCLIEEESVSVGDKNSISLDVTNHDHKYQPFCLENDFCDIDTVQDSILEDMGSGSNSN